MKKWAILAAGVALFLVVAPAFAAKPDNPPGQTCATIPGGSLVDSMGNPLTTGYNQYGYNYQARMSNQGIEEYCQQRHDSGSWDYDACMEYFGDEHFELIMKWNDAWLSNKDCDGDGLLDRHYGHLSYIGSGAWLTNHQRGTYEQNGKTRHWEYFVKIIAVPSNAYKVGGYHGTWYAADGTEIGPSIWGSFAVIQEVYNDTGTGEHGVEYLSPDHAGFGGW